MKIAILETVDIKKIHHFDHDDIIEHYKIKLKINNTYYIKKENVIVEKLDDKIIIKAICNETLNINLDNQKTLKMGFTTIPEVMVQIILNLI